MSTPSELPQKRADARFTVDDAFIGRWECQYDSTEHDEEEYQKILRAVSANVARMHGISKPTFVQILDWKAPRVKGKINWKQFDSYRKAFRRCLETPDEGKLTILTDLDGIGVPVASTILHFVHPDRFPIMDVRTVETLYHAGYIESKQRDSTRYVSFRQAMLAIAQRHADWSLRQIDRALFAYHKQELERGNTKKLRQRVPIARYKQPLNTPL